MEEWRYCAQWLIECQVIPPNHRVTWEGSQAFDLAQTLRDGVLLCQLLNRLLPGAIDLKEIALRPQMSQFLCLKNIRIFIQACIEKFGLRRQELFDPYQLFDVSDFGKVISTLSKLSHSLVARTRTAPFPPANHRQRGIDEDIYKTLEELADERDLADEDPDDLYDTVYTDVEDDDIYGELCDIKSQLIAMQQKSPVVMTTRDYNIQEIVETEKNFVDALAMIIKHFIKTLNTCISAQDLDIIFINIEKLYEVHAKFLKRTKDAVDRNSVPLSKVFIEMKSELLVYGEYCAKLSAAQEHIDEICKSPEVAMKIEECQMRANDGKFRLRDLLTVPMQRILKYHLLIRELERHTDANHPDKKGLKEALEAMQDLSMYVNEVKRDSEALQTISEIQQTVQEYIGPDLKQYGRLLKDGEMKLKSHDKTADVKTRYVFLFDKVMLICKTRTLEKLVWGPDCYVYKEKIELHKYGIETNLPASKAGRWRHCWNFTPKDLNSGSALQCFVKAEEQKRKWIENINMAQENITPRHNTTHKYAYTTFDKPVYCAVCAKLLCGIFYQGYKCSKCEICGHKQCLSSTGNCTPARVPGGSAPPLPPPRKPQQSQSQTRHSFHEGESESVRRGMTLPNRMSCPAVIINSEVRGVLNRAKSSDNGKTSSSSRRQWIATHNYAGMPNPPAPQCKPLLFAPNDIIEVRNRSDDHWWEGRNVRTSATGVFPKSYVTQKSEYEPTTINSNPRSPAPIPEDLPSPVSPMTPTMPMSPTTPMSPTDFNRYPWFAGNMERLNAESKLDKCPNGAFLIRGSTRTNAYVLSIKHNNAPKHIKIRDTGDKSKHFLADTKMFDSIPDLVSFYESHSLSPSFPGVDTTLQMPFKGIISRKSTWSGPKSYDSIGKATALYDFAARDTRELSLEEGNIVNILSKAGGHRGWWKGQIDDRVGYFPSTYVEEH
ncbi:guanine nucleotide exchange factor VAV2-like isoform X1 [Glandiceps talaboti]